VDVAVATASAEGAGRLAAVRDWWRVRHPPRSLGQRLDLVYTSAITAAIFGALVYGTASAALAQVVTPDWLAVFGPSLALLSVLLTAHWGAYQGPVVFSVADVAFLLGAPLPRRALAVRRLLPAFAAGAAAGAAAAAVLVVGLAGQGRGIEAGRAAATVAGLAVLGVLGVAAAWAVERSAGWERAARRAAWPAVLAAVALALASSAGAVGREIALWSGPWGWAVQAGAGAATGEWAAALVLLTLVAAAAAIAAARDCGECPAERHLRRAEARATTIASLATMDARTARRALEEVGARRTGRGAPRLRRARDPRLAIPWRDAVAGLGNPGRVVEGAVLTAAGAALALLNTDRPLAVPAGMLLAYFGAARLLWPMRAEIDSPPRSRVLLRPPIGRVLLAHTLLPGAVAVCATVLAAAGCALSGAAGAAEAVVAVAAVPVVLLCAAMAARRGGRVPATVFVTAVGGDPSGGAGALLAWFALWPTTAAALGALPLLVAANGGATGALIFSALAGTILAGLVARELPDA
jgi:hypothetical protein